MLAVRREAHAAAAERALRPLPRHPRREVSWSSARAVDDARSRAQRDQGPQPRDAHPGGGEGREADGQHPDARRSTTSRATRWKPPLPRFLQSAARRRAAQPPRPRAVARRRGESAHRARDGEPLLAGTLRHRHREDERGLRHHGRAPVASGTARLARGRIPRERLGREEALQAARHQRDLSPGRGHHTGEAREGSATTACSAAARASAWMPR